MSKSYNQGSFCILIHIAKKYGVLNSLQLKFSHEYTLKINPFRWRPSRYFYSHLDKKKRFNGQIGFVMLSCNNQLTANWGPFGRRRTRQYTKSSGLARQMSRKLWTSSTDCPKEYGDSDCHRYFLSFIMISYR